MKKPVSRLVSLLLTLVMIAGMLPADHARAFDEGVACEFCGKMIIGEQICEEGDHCSEYGDPTCYEEHHCSECGTCMDFCPECKMCESCAIDAGLHCVDCGSCGVENPLCPGGCGRCGECAGDWCMNCGMCVECAIEDGTHCPDCGKCESEAENGLCDECQRCEDCTDGVCPECNLCIECAIDQGKHCENCGSCGVEYPLCPGGCGRCGECAGDWCTNCGMCVECAINDGTHCPDCGICQEDAENGLCEECHRCENCTDGVCPECQLCIECAIDQGKHCKTCGSCGVEHPLCPGGCGRCGECAGDWCTNCGMCLDCAIDYDLHCRECGECQEDVEFMCPECHRCDVCGNGYCSECNLCLDCAIAQEKHCMHCGSCGMEHPLCPGGCGRCGECAGDWCTNCGMCVDCAEGQDKHCHDCLVCQDETEFICPQCHRCETCSGGYCSECNLCLDCAEALGKHCSSCGSCGVETPLCPGGCGRCGECAGDWCLNCGMCVDCGIEQHKHCEDCGVCWEETEFLCPECHRCDICSDGYCSDCNLCIDCAISQGLHCQCGQCLSTVEHVCSGCGRCSVCMGDYCEDCGLCEDCAMARGLHCQDCGACFKTVESYCPECLRCSDCTGEVCLGCGTCSECTTLCPGCGEYCSSCADFCPVCGGTCSQCTPTVCGGCGACESCARICPDCGDHCDHCADVCGGCGRCETCAGTICAQCHNACTTCQGPVCPTCGLCETCCRENSEAAGCSHGICVSSPEWETHWQAEHEGKQNTASYTVQHCQESLTDPGTYTVTETETDTYTIGAKTRVGAKSYPGFAPAAIVQQTVKADGSTVVTVNYDRVTIQVHFVGNGADSGTMADQTFRYGEEQQKLTANGFTRKGYAFAGWNTRSDGTGTALADQASYGAPADAALHMTTITLHARWSKQEDRADYVVKHYKESQETAGVYELADTETLSGVVGKMTKAGEKTYEGYTCTADYHQTKVAADGSTVIEIRYRRNWMEVHFDANGGSGAMNRQNIFYTDEGTRLTPNEFTREGYVFAGWVHGSDEQYLPDGAVVNADKTIDATSLYLKAQWVEADRLREFFGTAQAPVGGTHPSYTISVPDGAPYSARIDEWIDKETGETVLAEDQFVAGRTYEAAVYFTVPPKEKLADDAKLIHAAINGTDILVGGFTLNKLLTRHTGIWGFWTVTVTDTMVTDVSAQLDQPVAGGHPDFTPTVPADVPYTAVIEGWYDYEGLTMTEDDVFEAGRTYELAMDFMMEDGYTTPTNVESMGVTINGVELKAGGASHIGEKSGIWTSWKVTIPAGEAASYTVHHLQEKLEAPGTYAPYETEILTGKAGEKTAAAARTYEGFTAQSVTQIIVKADGTAVVEIRYDRNVHNLIWKLGGGTATGSWTEGAVPYGTAIAAPEVSRVGYTFRGWDKAVAETMPDEDLTYTASWSKNGGVTPKPTPKPETRPEEKLPFVDVDEDDYFSDAVEWAVEEGITSGVDARHFAPEGFCTRAQAVTFLWRAAGEPKAKTANNPFADVKKTDYFYEAVLWAVEEGITKGTSRTTFSPYETCTRAQIVTFLWRAEGEPVAAGSTFADVSAGAYYAEAVQWAVTEEITTGTSKTTFSPDQTCTRAQIVSFLYRAK